MTDTAKLMHELRMKIEANRKQLEEQERALLVLEQMMAAPSLSAAKPYVSTVNASSSIVSLSDLGIKPQSDRPTQKQVVQEAIKQLGTQEFTIPHVEALLKRNGNEFPGKHARGRIAVVMGQLEKEGLIVKTFSGVGSAPNKYKLKSEENLFQ